MSDRSYRATRAARRGPPQTPAPFSLGAALVIGFLGAVVSAVVAGLAGGGFLFCLLAYGLGGALVMTGAVFVQVARPLRPRLARATAVARHPAAHFSH